jgi:hypothetical protein
LALILSISFVSRPVTIVVALAVLTRVQNHVGRDPTATQREQVVAVVALPFEHAVCGGGERSRISVSMLRWRKKVPQQAVRWL